VLDVVLLAGEEVIEADDIVALIDHAFADVAAEEAGTAGDEDSFVLHGGGWGLGLGGDGERLCG
jgi:hypothetical protein